MKYIPGVVHVFFPEKEEIENEEREGGGTECAFPTVISSREFADEDRNYQMEIKMYDAMIRNELETYQTLFHEFMEDETWVAKLTYIDGPATWHHYCHYPYCTCYPAGFSKEDMVKQHKHLYYVECKCKPGKYWNELKNAYGLALSLDGYNRENVERADLPAWIEEKGTREQKDALGRFREKKPPILGWLETLESETLPLLFSWCHLHLEKYESFDYCQTCQSQLKSKSNSNSPSPPTILTKQV